jgi:hypothetical protein
MFIKVTNYFNATNNEICFQMNFVDSLVRINQEISLKHFTKI